ncbi:hypothetical protein ABB02_00483 [Clostridiaceae bacterium JG1575]|nr:hypothetical protein ABB02_00483 [Clostridiaceae bacterium JG1575]
MHRTTHKTRQDRPGPNKKTLLGPGRRRRIRAGGLLLVLLLGGCQGDKKQISLGQDAKSPGQTIHLEKKNGPAHKNGAQEGRDDRKIAPEYQEERGVLVQATSTQAPSEMVCEIKGAVQEPGVYRIPKESRVVDLIEKARGLSPEGSTKFVNQARKLRDGEVVIIPSKTMSREEVLRQADALPPAAEGSKAPEEAPTKKKICINTADQKELESLAGIGPATATRILDYRKEHGRFQCLDDLKKVQRIGDKLFEQIKNDITLTP